MGDVQVGDQLLGPDGRPCTVTSKSGVFDDRPCYKLVFAGGGTVVCSDDHLWTLDARARRSGTFRTSYLAKTWREGKIRRPVYRLRNSLGLQLPPVNLPIPPYTFGVWVGDGSSDCTGPVANHVHDDEMMRHVEADGYRVERKCDRTVRIYAMRGQLIRMGMYKNKHIPQEYLRSSTEQRISLLQGLMDTDGTVGVNRTMTPCSFCSMWGRLALQFVELLSTLGIRSRVHSAPAMFNGRNYGLAHKVEFYPGDFPVFRLSRKQLRLTGSAVAERQDWRTLIGVRKVRSVKTQCIAVDNAQRLFLVTEHFLATHNTTDSRARAYIEEHGESSWELDALPPNILADLIRSAVLEYRDEDLWNAQAAEEERHRNNLAAVADNWDEVAEQYGTGNEEEGDEE